VSLTTIFRQNDVVANSLEDSFHQATGDGVVIRNEDFHEVIS
jgi:hypothetical protein